MREHPARGARGFSVIELLVALAVVLVALTLTADLLIESQKLFVHSVREQLDPLVALTMTQLRNDIRGAAGAVAPGGAGHPLLLVGHPLGMVRYEQQGDQLLRTLLDGSGKPIRRRPVLRGIESFGWREEWAGVLSLEIVYRRQATPALDAVGRRRLASASTRLDTLSFETAFRGGARENRW